MSLRWKVIVVVAITSIAVIAATFIVSEATFMKGFQTVENRHAQEMTGRAVKALNDDLQNLNTLNHDWAAWDDTYNFVQNPKDYQSYITANPTDTTFAGDNLNFIFIIDNSDHLVFGKAFDLVNNVEIPIPASLTPYIFSETLTHHDSVDDNVSGFFQIPEGTVMISSQPILTSQGEGPIAGTIMMARFLDQKELSSISSVVQLPLSMVTVNETNIPQDFQAANASLSNETAIVTRTLSSTSIAGYGLVSDIYGKPAFILKATMPRDIYAQSKTTMNFFLLSLLGLAVLFGFVLIFFFSKLVIVRVRKVADYVGEIRTNSDLSQRLAPAGNDEITKLMQGLNNMVAALQESQKSLQMQEKAEAGLRLTIESVVEGIATTDLDGKITDVNDSKILLHGYSSKEELIGKSVLDLIAIEDQPKAKEALVKVLSSGVDKSDEYKMVKKDGSNFFGERSAALLRSPTDDPIGFVISTRDITEKKLVQSRLERSEEKYSTIVEKGNDGVVVLQDGLIKFSNARMHDILGFASGEEIGQPFTEFISPTFRSLAAERYKRRLAGEKVPAKYEIAMLTQNGKEIPVEVNANQINFEDKPADLAFVRDISEQKQAQEQLNELNTQLRTLNQDLEKRIVERTKQLEEAMTEAKASNNAKSEFLASMSHELRTPLNAIIGFSQMLEEQYFGPLNEKQAEYVTDILSSGNHLLSLINDILDLSKIEAGKMEMSFSEIKIADIVRGSLIMVKEKAQAHNIALEINIEESIENLEITGDERRLKQVMFNLLSNSTKFTPDGGIIKVEVTREGQELIISVSDSGIGITVEEQRKLFQAFYQASGGIKGKTPGTGLGLSITKDIVEKHGGRIWAESKGRNQGTRFIVKLPIKELVKSTA